MTRIGRQQLVELISDCDGRRKRIVEFVGEFRLATSDDLRQLFFVDDRGGASSSRHTRRELVWLCGNRFLDRHDRRIGGRGAGSDSYTYRLGPTGRRAIEYWSGNGLALNVPRDGSSPSFVEHTLAITETYVSLMRASVDGRFDLVEWQSEPKCWRLFTGPHGIDSRVKPDGFVVLAHREFEHFWFVEVDRSTQRAAAIRRKISGYKQYAASGVEQRQFGLFPHLLWVCRDAKRVERLEAIFRDAECGDRFFAATLDDMSDVVVGGSS